MSLKNAIDRELQRCTTAGPAANPHLDVDTGNGRLKCEFTQLDQVGCGFLHLTLETDQLATATPDELQRLGRAVASRLKYLLEPISLVEVDADSATVQLRSNPPSKDDDGTAYYELIARRGGALSLCRYRKSPGQVRARIEAQITREVFHRLARDFVDALNE